MASRWGLLILLALAVVFGLNAALSTGNVHYVAPNGDDSNPGTEDRPWKSIQYAVDHVNPGDSIAVRGGIYHESVQFHQSGREGGPITLTNYDGEVVTVSGGESPAILDKDGTQYWIIDGFRLDSNAYHTIKLDAWGCNGTCGGTHHWIIRNNKIIGAVQIYGSYNLFEGNEVDGSQHKGSEDGVKELYDVSHHNIYRNNHIHHFASRGLWSMHRTHDCLFENNYIHHITDGGYGGMGIDTDGFGNVEWRHTIRGNHLHDCGESGIEMENTFDSIVENNIIHDTGTRGIDVINYGWTIPSPGDKKCEAGGENNQYGDTDGDNDCEGDITKNMIRQNLIYNGANRGGIVLYHAGGVKIWGNTIYNTNGSSVWLNTGVEYISEIELRGNIFAESKDSGEVSLIDFASLAIDNHNLFYHPGWGEAYEIRESWKRYSVSEYQLATSKGQGSIEGNPQSVNPSAGDFHLQLNSPAIDTGIDIGLTTDLDSNPRPQGAGYDIGVYDRAGGVQPTSTPTPVPPTSTPTPTLEATPTIAAPTRTNTPTLVPPTVTPTPTNTPRPTNTPTSTATRTATPAPSATPAGTETTITLQQGSNRYSGSEDTYIYQYAPNSNYYREDRLQVGYKQQYAALLRFDLKLIPANAIVTRATLRLYAIGWSGSNITVGTYYITRTVNLRQTTWDQAQNGNNWSKPGCNDTTADRLASAESTVTTSSIGRWYDFDLTAVVQGWVNGSLANNGVLLRATYSSSSFRFASAQNRTIGWRPKLVITYHTHGN